METKEILQTYRFDDFIFVTNFKTFNDAEEYAFKNNGELVEIGFIDGADNPELTTNANLIEERKPFKVELPYSTYNVYYSYDDFFQEIAKSLQFQKKRLEDDMFLEDIWADQNIAQGDRILIVDNGEIVTITTKERIKYLMGGHLYEVAVKLSRTK